MDYNLVLRAAQFASDRHRDQHRKDTALSPYINHPIDVAHMLCETADIQDPDILAAALLHDTLEDTETAAGELESKFGQRVLGIVQELTDDKKLPKDERKRLQIEHAGELSKDAVLIKLADKISNVRDIICAPPSDWGPDRRRGYLDWAEKVVDNCQHVNGALKEKFDTLIEEGRAVLDQ